MAEPKPKRQRRSSGDASRQKILDAATEIASERGYEGTSIGLVSERSGQPASSIYWHFKDKDALIAAVIDHSFETWLATAGDGDQTDTGPIDKKLAAMVQRTGKALRESADFLRLGLMLTLEKRAAEPTARRRFLEVRHDALQRTMLTYARLFPKLDDTALHQLATFTMAAADGLFINSEIEGPEGDTAAVFDLLTAAILGAARHLQKRSTV